MFDLDVEKAMLLIRRPPRALVFWLLAPPLAAGAGALAVTVPTFTQGLSADVVQILFVGGCVLCVLVAGLLMRRGMPDAGFSRLGTLIFGGGLLLAAAVPGAQLLSGIRTPLLSELNGPAVVPAHDVPAAYLLFLLALATFIIGQEAVARARPRSLRLTISATLDSRATYIALLLVGVAALGAIHARQNLEQIAASRGLVRGLGYIDVPSWGLPIAVSMGIVRRHWGSKVLASLSCAALLLLLLESVSRSPLLLIAVAALLRLLHQAGVRRHFLRYLLGVAVLLWAASTLAVSISAWRADLAQGVSSSLPAHVVQSVADPISNLSSSGLDTLEGMILATKVDPQRVGATWYDPMTALTDLVPYQLWPTKPTDLGATVTHTYTDFGGQAGLFLSGPGYLYIIFGGALGMGVGFAVIGAVSEWVLRRWQAPTAMTCIFVYGLTRFMFAGGSYDLSNTLAITALLSVIAYAIKLARATHSRVRDRHTRPPLTVRPLILPFASDGEVKPRWP